MVCGSLILPCSVFADTSPQEEKPVPALFKAMDANGDGKVSPDEHAKGARRMFETMDANQDGVVTAEEMSAAHEKITGRPTIKTEMSSAEKIKAVDADGDGRLTDEEHAAGSRKMFDMMDRDKDGYLTEAEVEAGHAKMLKKQPD
jgi:Ca2+-binding EF-hand superfamily protein